MSPEEHFNLAKPGRLVVQDEGGRTVFIDIYVTGERERVARIEVTREVLAQYALRLLEASQRNVTAT